MRCEIYGSPTSTHYTQIVGHIADDGNVYNSRSGEAGAEELRRCVGHDKKTAGGTVQLVIVRCMGQGELVTVPLSDLWEDKA